MTTELAPRHEAPMLDDQPGTTPWALALERLANPEPGRTSWLATVRPDGRPHLMPIIAFWIDGAFHFVVGEGTRKGRNLAADGRCVVATGSTTPRSAWWARSRMAFAFASESPARRIRSCGVASTRDGAGKAFSGYSARNLPKIVAAALPESCWYTMLCASASNDDAPAWGGNPEPPTRSMTAPRARSLEESSAQTAVQSIGAVPRSGQRQGIGLDMEEF